MQKAYQFFFISVSVCLVFFVCVSWAMEESLETLFFKTVQGYEETFFARLCDQQTGYETIKDDNEKIIASIDWNNGNVHTYYRCEARGTKLITFNIDATKRLLQSLDPSFEESQEVSPEEITNLLQSPETSVEETSYLLMSSQESSKKPFLEDAEQEYASTVENLQRSFRKYFVGENDDNKKVQHCCWGCCLY